MNYVIYDIETTLSCFLVVLKDFQSKKSVCYRISKFRNDYNMLIKHWKSLIERDYYFVGFNSLNFDSQIIEFILKKERTYSEIYDEAQRVINLPDEGKWEHIISEWNLSFKNIDLFKIYHYDNKNRRTSLKWCEFSMRMNNIEEMPLPHDISYTEDEENLTEKYCEWDVEATEKLLEKSLDKIQLRFDIGNTYNLNLTNANDPKIGSEIFKKLLEENLNRKISKERTYRPVINIGEIILDYIQFETVECKLLLDAFKKLKITGTSKPFEYSIKLGNITYYFGVGGIHGAIQGVHKPNENELFKSFDISSMYPNTGIQNRLYPQHLGEKFCDIYEEVYKTRAIAKKAGNKAVNEGLKLALNGSYGKSNDVYSFFYDPKYTMSITINGQLLLLMLIEKLYLAGFQMKVANTDGCELIIPKRKEQEYYKICKDWENLTKYELEYFDYSVMYMRDVNNYIAVYTNGKIKRKGCFEIYDDFVNMKAWNKNPSFLIIPLALQEYFVNGVDFRDFIKNHTNMYDFCGGIKKKSDFDLIYLDAGEKKYCSKVTRYYIAKKGYYLIKDYGMKLNSKTGKMVHTTTKVESEYACQILNKLDSENAQDYKINYNYYIKAVEKIIFEIEGNLQQTTLF